MPQKQLRDSLAELRAEIDSIEAIDDESRARLNQVVDQVQQTVDSPDEVDHQNLLESLDDSVRHFEVAHPNITDALNKVMVALSNIGIQARVLNYLPAVAPSSIITAGKTFVVI